MARTLPLIETRGETETLWLKEAPTHPLQQALKDLECAYTNFFAKRADFPRFKKRGQRDSFRYPDPAQIRLGSTDAAPARRLKDGATD
jgi:putative transposase